MAGTRSSARLANANSSSPTPKDKKSSPRAGSKRKADSQDSSPAKGKRGLKATKQQTLEDTKLGVEKEDEDQSNDTEMNEVAFEGEGTGKPADAAIDPGNDKGADGPGKGSATEGTKDKLRNEQHQKVVEADPNAEPVEEEAVAGAENEVKAEAKKPRASRDAGNQNKFQQKHVGDGGPAISADQIASTNDGAVEESSDRSGRMPSNIIEKGVIYFFTRGRVGVEAPESVKELQRSYIVLRPIPIDGKIGNGAIQDANVARLIALPKKVLPRSGRDRFMVFVEKVGVSMDSLKKDFFQGSEYDTKTLGTRQTPPVTPVGEGVYALTTTGRASNLVYMLTIPRELGEVQNDMGIREKGSFVTSLKNPAVAGAANARLPEGPGYPKEFIGEFGNRGWMPIHKVDFLDYANAQLLLIGQNPKKFAEALEQTAADAKHDKEAPQEELEKLEDEDQIRVEHLKGDDSVFEDLGISKKEYPDVATTW